MYSLGIYIPTRGRVGQAKQVTLRELLAKSSHKPVIVCPPDEVKLHRAYYPRVIGCERQGIGPTRQWILETSGCDIVVMMDDDLRINYRPDPTQTKLEVCEQIDPLIDLIYYTVIDKGYIHGGVGARQGNNHKDFKNDRHGVLEDGHVYQDCERANNFHFMHRESILNLGVRMDALPVMEDFHFTLSLLTKGYPNRIIHDYVWNQEGSGKDGGCSIYRTATVQAEGADGLKDAFPDFVRVVEKESKDTSPAWKDFKKRKDVVVQWLKAYQSSQRQQ